MLSPKPRVISGQEGQYSIWVIYSRQKNNANFGWDLAKDNQSYETAVEKEPLVLYPYVIVEPNDWTRPERRAHSAPVRATKNGQGL